MSQRISFATVCSGIRAPEVALSRLGWQPLFASEIEKFPKSVGSHHFPNAPDYGDMNKYHEWPQSNPDVIIAGTPCQSFSVAGLRKGLDDPRGNLTLVFLGLLKRFAPRWVLWENVPGILSHDEGRSFGAFLSGLAKLGYGFAYRVLDAQYFGVAQRRRRLFVVGHIGGRWQRPATVLFERQSMCGDSAPSREAGKRITDGIAGSLGVRGTRSHTELDGHGAYIPSVIPIQEIGQRQSGTSMNGVGHGKPGDPMFTLQRAAVHGIAAPLAGCSNGGGPNGPDRTADDAESLIPVCLSSGQGNAEMVSDGEPSLTCLHEAPIAFQPRIARNGRGDMGDKANALQAQSGRSGKGDAAPCVAFQPRYFTRDNKTVGADSCGDQIAALSADHGSGDSAPHVSSGMEVRRLTPRECERLQGFPDDYTLIPTGKEHFVNGKKKQPWAADGPRYKALGNSMAVPVIEWIGRRIQMVEDLSPAPSEK